MVVIQLSDSTRDTQYVVDSLPTHYGTNALELRVLRYLLFVIIQMLCRTCLVIKFKVNVIRLWASDLLSGRFLFGKTNLSGKDYINRKKESPDAAVGLVAKGRIRKASSRSPKNLILFIFIYITFPSELFQSTQMQEQNSSNFLYRHLFSRKLMSNMLQKDKQDHTR